MRPPRFFTIFLGLTAAVLLAPASAEPDPVGEPEISWPPHSNPTHLLITSRQGQSQAEQTADQWQCYDDTCLDMQWDPYEAYDALVAEGYAVSLSRREMEHGLVFLAIYGAEVGAVAGDIADRHHGSNWRGAEIGASIAVAGELIRSQYLLEEESSESRRVVRRYERNLRQWVRKYSACLVRAGYRVN